MPSIAARNIRAIIRMKMRAFERIDNRCQLLDAKATCELLGITELMLRQAARAGKLLTYTHTDSCKMFYPSFQFFENTPRAVVETMINSLDIDPGDTEAMNSLVQHLTGRMDYSNPGEPSNELPRFSLMDDPAALDIIMRDYVNALMPGQ